MTRSRAPWLRGLLGLAAILAAIQAAPLGAATPEAQVKAAYLYKLASFVRWPAATGDRAFRICVASRPDIAGVLEDLARNQRVDGRPVALIQLRAADAVQARDCNILFLGRGGQTARTLLAAAARAPVLIVTDRSNGTRGGAIEFVLRQSRVRFAIDRGDAEARGLEISSKLLDVAVEVAS